MLLRKAEFKNQCFVEVGGSRGGGGFRGEGEREWGSTGRGRGIEDQRRGGEGVECDTPNLSQPPSTPPARII